MKLNKTLTEMKNANNENGAITIYGYKAFYKVLNFKAVTSVDINDYSNILIFKLTDGSTITAFYSEIC